MSISHVSHINAKHLIATFFAHLATLLEPSVMPKSVEDVVDVDGGI